MEKDLKIILVQMIISIREMIDLIYQGFMENDTHYLNSALNKERIVDDWEKSVTTQVVQPSQSLDEQTRKKLILVAQTAQNIERMGDELRSLIERIEIKIAEELFFSDMGLAQYQDVFKKMCQSVDLTFEFLETNKAELLEDILKNGEQVKKLVEQYRVEHLERLTKGICQPRAANMFFDMLDFTGNIARHCTNIARIYKENK